MSGFYLRSPSCIQVRSHNPSWRSSRRQLFTKLHQTSSSSRVRKYVRRSGYVALGIGTFWATDKTLNASAIFRNFRTLWTCAAITLDYKWNFTPEKSDLIPQLHERVAERMYNLFISNGGLYIKIGQAIGANAALLPKPMQLKFSKLFDDAPQIPYSTVEQVFRSELGRPACGPGGVFEIFEEKAVASASIAQVHKAKLWPSPGDTEEKWVAVKIQKPDVRKQMEWDLGVYRVVMWMFEHWAFDLPVYFVVDFVSDHLRKELDFLEESKNARKTAEFIRAEPRLADKVYIPRVYPEYSTKRVMTAEWIDGVRLSDRTAIRTLMGEPESRSSSSSSPAAFPDSPSPTSPTSTPYAPSKPLKGGLKAIIQPMVELFSAQMFNWGWVHCDPHPGNVIIRESPSRPGHPQLVLIDHGLYVGVEEEFRRQWVSLWRGMLAGDFGEVESVTRAWGMGGPELMASATLMKPVRLRRNNDRARKKREKDTHVDKAEGGRQLSQYEMSVLMKKKLKEFLADTDRMPKVLIFLMRNMRMVQGNNQSFSSPVNRIKITGFWASRSLFLSPHLTFTQRLREYFNHLAFRVVMFSIDLAFWKNKIIGWVRWKLGMRVESFEDELDRNIRGFAKANLGVDVTNGAFEG